MGFAQDKSELGGAERIRLEIKTALFLWYTANQNSDRDLSEKIDYVFPEHMTGENGKLMLKNKSLRLSSKRPSDRQRIIGAMAGWMPYDNSAT